MASKEMVYEKKEDLHQEDPLSGEDEIQLEHLEGILEVVDEIMKFQNQR